VGRVRAHAEFTDIPTIVDGRLDPFLEELQKEIYEVSDEVEAHFFRAGTDLQLHFQRWA
jgi:A predicted alpha-helical domain with a conserved ER motif.